MDVAPQRTTTPSTDAPLSIARLVEGQVTCLRFAGVINESFSGRQLASGIKAQTLVLEFSEVKRISSFGLREWSNFIEAVERSVQRIIAIGLPPKVVDQLNMVSRFLGNKGDVFSLYAPYRCDYCDLDSRVLLQVDRDRAAIVTGNPPERTCESCSRPEYFDEDASTFFSYVAAQQPFEMPKEVADFLASKLKYSVTGNDRGLQIDKHVEGRSTYLRLVGNLDGSFPSNKIAEGLEGTIVIDVSGVGTIDLAGAAEWRNLVTLTKQSAERILVLGCPPVLLERLNRQGDLGDVVVSFSMPYSCKKCATTSSQTIDVAEHFDILKFATPPEMRCGQCKSPTVCSAPETLLSRLRTLAKPELDPGLKKFIRESKERKPAKSQAAAPLGRKEAAAPRMGLWMGLMLVVLIGAAGMMILVYRQQQQLVNLPPGQAGGLEVQYPSWITSQTPLVADCSDLVNKVSCVGVSAFSPTKEAGQAEATLSALEAMTHTLNLRIDDKDFAEKVRARYDATRADALGQLEKYQGDPNSAEFKAALERVRDGRQRVAEAFRRTGGSAAPAQQADWFWTEFNADKGGKEYLVFVRFDASADAIRKLADEYTTVVEVGGARLLTVYPQLAWALPGDLEGALVVEAGGLTARGVADGDVVVAIGEQPVRTATEAAARLREQGGDKASLAIVRTDGSRHELR